MDIFDLQASLSINIEQYARGLQNALDLTTAFSRAIQTGLDPSQASQAMNDFSNRVNQALGNVQNFGQDTQAAGNQAAQGLNQASQAALDFGDIIKANLVTDVIKTGLSSLVSGVKAGVDAFKDLAVAAKDAYATYEQVTGGVETLYKNAYGSVVENAEAAYKSAGMAANDYMDTANQFAGSMIKAITTVKNEATIDVDSYKKDLNSFYDAMKDAYDEEYENTKEHYNDVYEARKEAYDEQYEQTKQAYSDQLDAVKETHADLLDALKEKNDEEYDAVKDKLDKELDALKEEQEEELKALEESYKEKLQYIDKEEYERLKAIDEQIAGINATQTAEDEARTKKAEEEKKARLQEKISAAETNEEKIEAEKAYREYLDELEAKEREKARKAQIENLKEQKEQIKDNAKEQRDTLKEGYDQQKADMQDANANELEERKKANEEQLKQLKKAQQEQEEEFKKANDERLKAISRNQTENLKMLKESYDQQLSDLKKAQDAQLEAMKKAHETELSDYKNFISDQVEAAKEAANAEGERREATEEDYELAAEYIDKMIQMQSDNANKMGTNIELVKNAYTGFMRGNYMMLDNLNLGFAGTKEGMQELLTYASTLNEEIDPTDFSMTNIIDAIYEVQTAMGITGTTAEEAMGTIEGASHMTSAAWQNVVTAIAGGGDLKEAISNLFDAIFGDGTTAENGFNTGLLGQLSGRFKIAFEGIAQFVEEAAPLIVEKIPVLIEDIKPAFLKLVEALGSIFKTIATYIGPAIKEVLPDVKEIFFSLAGDIIGSIVDGIGDMGPVSTAITTGLGLILGADVIGKITGFINAVQGIGTAFSGASAIVALEAGAMVACIVTLKEEISTLVDAYDTYKAAGDAHNNEINTALESYRKLYQEKGKEIADEWAKTVYQIDTSNMSLEAAQSALVGKIETYWDGVPQSMMEGFQAGWDSYKSEGGGRLGGIALVLGDAFQNGLDTVRNLLGIHSPSTVMAEIGKNMMEGTVEGVEEVGFGSLLTSLNNVMGEFVNTAKDEKTHQELREMGISIIDETRSGMEEQESKNGIGSTIDGYLSIASSFIEKNNKLFRLLGGGIIDETTAGMEDEENRNGITVTMNDLLDNTTNTLNLLNNRDKLREMGFDIIDETQSGMDEAEEGHGVQATMSDLMQELINTANGTSGEMEDAGVSLFEGLKAGMSSTLDSVIDTAKEASKNILDSVKSFFGINSPSTQFKKVGNYLMEGLEGGIVESIGKVESAMDKVKEAVNMENVEYSVSPAVENTTRPKGVVSSATTTSLTWDELQDLKEVRRLNSKHVSSAGAQAQGLPSLIEPKNQEENKNITVVLELDGAQFGRTVYQYNQQETQRVGVKLAGGFA